MREGLKMKLSGMPRKHNLSTLSNIIVLSLCYMLPCSYAFSFDEEAGIMEKNVSPMERLLRITGGMILITMTYFKLRNTWQIRGIFGLGLYGVVTGLAGVCLIYTILGINTVERDRPMKIWSKRFQHNTHPRILEKKGGEI